MNAKSTRAESNEAVARRLECARNALTFDTWTAFAEAVGISPQKLNNYTSARDRLPLEVAFRFRQKFGLSLDWIYTGDMSNLPLNLARRIDAIESERKRNNE